MEILHLVVHSDKARRFVQPYHVPYTLPMSFSAKASLNEFFLVQTCAIIAPFKLLLIEKTSLLFSKEKSVESSNWLVLTEVLKSSCCSSSLRHCSVVSQTLENDRKQEEQNEERENRTFCQSWSETLEVNLLCLHISRRKRKKSLTKHLLDCFFITDSRRGGKAAL